MNKLFSREFPLFTVIIIPTLLYWSSLLGRLYPIHLIPQVPFFFDLIEIHQNIPQVLILLFGFVNSLLIWQISKRVFKGKQALIPLLIFSISPWSAYLMFAGSFYIYLLSLLMLAFLGLLLLKEGQVRLGTLFFVTGSVLSIYSSVLILIIFLPIVLLLILNELITLEKVKFTIILIVMLCLPLFFFMAKNQIGFKNVLNNQTMAFKNTSFLSIINQFQGESKEADLGVLSKFSENKYIYISKFFLLKFVYNITPATYFTSQERLLMFSFTSPVFFGFLTPFLYGLYLILNLHIFRKLLYSSLILIIPSFLSKLTVDLNRLVIFEPVVIFIISYGLIHLAKEKKRIHKFLLFLCIFLVSVQFLVTIIDINIREYSRFERILGARFTIEKQ